MELRHLRYFATVAAERNLSRAAAKLHVAQPALTRQVQDLERELGATLLERQPKGVVPTLAGETLAREAARILADIAAALERAEAVGAGRRGRVTLGTIRAAMGRGFPAAVQEAIRHNHPEIDLLVEEVDLPLCWEALEEGRVDLVIAMEDAARPHLVAEPLWREMVDRAVVPSHHPLARRRIVTAADFGDLPLLYSRPATTAYVFDTLVAKLLSVGFKSPIVTVDGDVRAVHLAVSSGRGWTMIARSRARIPPEGTTVVEVPGLDFAIDVAVLWRQDQQRAVVRTVVETAMAVAREYPDQVLRKHPALPPAPAKKSQRAHAGAAIPAGLEVRHLRALLAVGAAHSIGRGAERLGITQPAMSRQMKELEHGVGQPLLERAARGARLTAAGASLAADVPAILMSLERLVQGIVSAKRGMEGRCVIGAVATSASTELLRRTMAACAAKHPLIQVRVQEMPTYAQPAAILRGDLDLGLAHLFVTSPPKDGLVRKQVIDDRMCAVLVPADHPLARKTRIKATALADLPFLFMARRFAPDFYDRIFRAFNSLGLEPLIEGEYEALHSVWSLTALGKGWCIAWESMLDRAPPGTAARRVTGFDLAWGVELLSRRGDRNPAVTAVAKELVRISRVPAETAG